MSRVAILGAGAFGTALALFCHREGHEVRVWCFEEELPATIAAAGQNTVYLPGFPLPPQVLFTADGAAVLAAADLVLIVIPAQFVRSALRRFRDLFPETAVIGFCAKGIEHDSLKLMSEIAAEELAGPTSRHVFLSGPTFAKELALGLPMDITAASRPGGAARAAQAILHRSRFRVYTSEDPTGVEVAGALKNVIAIACGTADELGMGLSARASLLSRGLAELTRFGVALGADPVTFLGLSGVGDLLLTCTAPLSRNYSLGRAIGRGGNAKELLASQKAIAEGYYTAKPAWLLARRVGIDAPITEQIYHVLYEGRPLSEAIRQLMAREPKDELAGIR
ncbi:MAG: NAD(P)-dependent glycerol-3-phosphate dehydrogenase [Candidatus Schekmanbacteria bacterium]|nr:NAD(P)-dependent glycerol-3-phosphate dehydrogenase [Candidatus Schekmanbacteria bacterium]